MDTLQDILARAGKEKWAVPHFNISDFEILKAAVEAAAETRAPLMIGTSEGERNFLGLPEAVALVKSFRDDKKIPIFLNADHTKSPEAARSAVDAGYDSIHIDLSAAALPQNIAGTKEVVEYARAKNKNISVEGELGYLRGESKVQNEKIQVRPEDLTNPFEAAKFVTETGVHRFAPAVGNIHGLSLREGALDIERIRAIRKALPDEIAIVLHAGSGVPIDQIQDAIYAGVSNIHVSTELRVAFKEALDASLHKNEGEAAPYKIMALPVEAVKQKAMEKIKLFGAEGKM